MKLNHINMIFFKVLTLISMFSLSIVAMGEEIQVEKLDPNYYPYVTFVNKTEYPINILLQSPQYYMSNPHTLKPNASIKLDLSEETGKGKAALINNLKIGYATGVSSYAPMQDISKITLDIENKKRTAELAHRSKQETLHLKVTVEILEDKSSWTPSLKYEIKYEEKTTKGIKQDIAKGSEKTEDFDIQEFRRKFKKEK